MNAKKIPALQLAIIRNGEIVKTGNYGVTNQENGSLVNSNTVFALNSITKAFTGVAVMQLVEEGKLDINKPVSTYLENLPESWRAISVKQLLNHTSGIPNIMDYNTNLLSKNNEKESWDMVQELPMDFEPGEKFRYNQTNYLLIGKIINKVSGMPFSDFIQKRQLEKIGANRTLEAGFTHYEDMLPNAVIGYVYSREGELVSVDEIFTPSLRTAAGMSSTATELARWIISLQKGELLDNEDSLKSLWKPGKLNNGDIGGFNRLLNGYALGFPIIKREEHPVVAPVGGGRSAMFIYPKDDLSIIVLTNLLGASPDSFIDEIAGFYIPEMKLKNGFGLPKNIKNLRSQLEIKGYNNALEIYKHLKVENQNFELLENDINHWGYTLLKLKENNKALEIFKLNIALFPTSANAYDSLGEMYVVLEDAKKALKNYRESLRLNPNNKNAKNYIKVLETKI